MHYINKVCLTSSDGSTKNGDTLDTNQWVSASFHFFTSGTADAGTVKLQASNDVCPIGANVYQVPFVVTHWVDIPNQSAVVASGAPAILTINNCTYRWLRAVWTSSGGSDSITVEVLGIYP